MTYSSTSLGYLIKYGPRAFRLHMAGIPCLRDQFNGGISAHAVLEEVGKKGAKEFEDQQAVADAAVFVLTTKGRSYFGVPEPPMRMQEALEGRELALTYLAGHELPAGNFEEALFVAGNRWRSLVDHIYNEERGDEEFGGLCLCVRDYKSAWPAGDDELDTLQRRMQAVAAWRTRVTGDHLGIALEIVNLRTGRTHERIVWLDEEGVALLTQWEKDIELLCRVADAALADEGDTCSPGMGCMGCPYLPGCPTAGAAIHKAEAIEDLATAFIVHSALRTHLAGLLKEALADCEPLTVPGGTVGFQRKERDAPTKDAAARVLLEWYQSIGRDFVDLDHLLEKKAGEVGLLQTLGMTKGGIEKVGKKLFPERRDVPHRREWIAGLLETQVVVEFGEAKAKKGEDE